MMESAPAATAPWWAAGGLFAMWAVREIWAVLRTRNKDIAENAANVDLLNGLAARVNSLEEAQAVTNAQLADEMRLRMTAQEEAHRLRLRILTLESALRQLGAVIPPEVT